MINSSDARREDRISVKPGDIAQQKQAMKKAGDLPTPAAGDGGKKGRGKGGRRAAGRQAATAPAAPPRATAPAAPSANPVDLIDKALDLAQQCGGVAALKRLADMQRW